jgi:LytS/YehU family sensor histidine kinase
VAALCTIEPARCRELVLQLADFLRHSLNHEGQQSSLAEELEVVRLYLAIEQVRFGERLQVKWDLPERLPERQMPAFLIQPLVENAVRHGLSPKESGGTVTLRVLEHSIVIEDDGVGCLGHTEGIGLSNVRQRLAGLGQLRLEPLASGGTRVEVEFLCAT